MNLFWVNLSRIIKITPYLKILKNQSSESLMSKFLSECIGQAIIET